MAQNIAVDSLLTERLKIIAERNRMNNLFNSQIKELETAIERIEGKTVWDYGGIELFDDTNPDYIKNSLEEI